jgi:hypothetical protein
MDKLMSTRISAKHIAIAAAGAAMLLTNAFPVFAKPNDSGTSTNQDGSGCGRIAGLADKLEGRLDDGRAKLLARSDDRDATLAAHRADWDAQLAARRQKWESDFADLIGRLGADGASNTSAIAAYKTAIEGAWTARNSAIDAADQSFRDGLDKLVADKKTTVENGSLAFKTAASAAFAKAESDCTTGAKLSQIMSVLRAALKGARDKFMRDRQSIDKIGSRVGDLVNVRQAVIEKAKMDFKSAAEKARAAFKASYRPTMSATSTKETGDGNGGLDQSATTGQ